MEFIDEDWGVNPEEYTPGPYDFLSIQINYMSHMSNAEKVLIGKALFRGMVLMSYPIYVILSIM